MGVVEGASLVYDDNIGKLVLPITLRRIRWRYLTVKVLNTPTFPAVHHGYDKSLPSRASVSKRDSDDGKANECTPSGYSPMLPILRAVCLQLLVRVYLMRGTRQFSSATLYVVKPASVISDKGYWYERTGKPQHWHDVWKSYWTRQADLRRLPFGQPLYLRLCLQDHSWRVPKLPVLSGYRWRLCVWALAKAELPYG
jgi:hypothetical protein